MKKIINNIKSKITNSSFVKNHNFSLFQRFISFLLIFFLLFNLAFRVPFAIFFSYIVSAENRLFYNLVSIVVNDEIFKDNELKNKLERYAKDVESVLKSTKVVIIPTPKDANSFNIASLIESLYFEGYKSLNKDANFESKLIGTLLVGDIPIPMVRDLDNYSKTILPYTDFEDKTYIYDNNKKVYEKTQNSDYKVKPEIWHGVISPNTGTKEKNLQAIKDYFDKNHDFYVGKGLFRNDLEILNGNPKDKTLKSYKPFVFYFDWFREKEAINTKNLRGYQAKQKNKEDLVYNRQTKDLAKDVKEDVLGEEQKETEKLYKEVFPGEYNKYVESGKNDEEGTEILSSSPDLLTRYSTKEIKQDFVNVFNFTSLGELRKNVYNAGRYSGYGDDTRADMIPYLISVIDLISDQTLKNANDTLEKTIDNAVKNGGTNDVWMFESYEEILGCERKLYKNYFYGKKTEDINKAEECSIYRGSLDNGGQLVIANNGYNVNKMKDDYDKIGEECMKHCKGDTLCMTKRYWWGNSSINLDQETLEKDPIDYKLKEHKLKGATTPLFDTAGTRRIENASKIHSPWDCKKGIGILVKKVIDKGSEEKSMCVPIYNLETNLGVECDTDPLEPGIVDFNDFTDVNDGISVPEKCDKVRIYVAGELFNSWEKIKPKEDDDASAEDVPLICIFKYKIVNSQIQHESPTKTELKTQVKGMTASALPVDKDRYTDFFGRDDKLKKIKYPQLFRLELEEGQENNTKNIKEKLKKYLMEQSEYVNGVVRSAEESGPELLANYGDVDFYNQFKNTKVNSSISGGEEKEFNYYETLAFALYWKNIKDITEKYQFVIENYLSDQFTGNKYKFGLPKNKKMYEISYLGAPGDASNMYVKMSPEEKITENPYEKEIENNAKLDNTLTGLNLGGGEASGEEGGSAENTDGDANFECGPPEGVPIRRWFPAIMCRLKNTMPPTIKIGKGKCSGTDLFDDSSEEPSGGLIGRESSYPSDIGGGVAGLNSESSDLEDGEKNKNNSNNSCDLDSDKNGVNDCLEKGLEKIEIKANSNKYFYNKSGEIDIYLRDKNGDIISYDNSTDINISLSKLNILNDDGTKTIIFGEGKNNEEDRNKANKYFSFNDGKFKSSDGKGKYSFSTKDQDLDAFIKVWIELKDFKGNRVKYLEDELKIEVRGSNMVTSSFVISKDGDSEIFLNSGLNSIEASDKKNLFLVDGNKTDVEEKREDIYSLSEAKDKFVISIDNYDKYSKKKDLKYPLNINLFLDGKKIIEDKKINSKGLDNILPFLALEKTGEYVIQIEDNEGLKIKRKFTVLPGKADNAKITFGSNFVENGGVITTNYLIVYDKYGNVANGDIYNVDGEIKGGGVSFAIKNDLKYSFGEKIEFQTVEGYKVFRLKTTDKIGDSEIIFNVKDSLGNKIFDTKEKIKNIRNVKFFLTPLQNDIKIGGGKYGFSFEVRDENSNIIPNFNSRVYLNIDENIGKSEKSYVDIKNGKGEVYFYTKNVATKESKLSFQIEGLRKPFVKYISVKPEKSIKIELILSKPFLENTENSYTILRAELKDRYGNLVYNDNSTELELEIKEIYSKFFKASQKKTVVNAGVGRFKVYATKKSGKALLKVKALKNFSSSFKVPGQGPFAKEKLEKFEGLKGFVNKSGLTEKGLNFFEEYGDGEYVSKFFKKEDLKNLEEFKNLTKQEQDKLLEFYDENNFLEVKAQNEAVTQIESFYFWNKSKIDKKSYNSLYTVLLGAEYGDITKKDYLASSLLFDKNNRSLAVTSLLNNPYNYNDIVSVSSKGKIIPIKKSENITQDIEYKVNIDKNQKLYLDIYNKALFISVGEIYYNLKNNNELKICENDGILDFSNCLDSVSNENTSILLKDISKQYSIEGGENNVYLKDSFGNDVFSISKDGNIFLKNGLKIENYVVEDIDKRSENPLFLIKDEDEILGIFSFNIVNGSVNLSRDYKLFNSKLNSFKNTVLVYVKSNNYGNRLIRDKEKGILMIYYKDPFSDPNDLNLFSAGDNFNYESFRENYKVGWAEGNKSLLLFSAGESVGESTKKYASFSLINLGDPVVNLKKIKVKLNSKDRSFDKTTGMQLTKNEDNVGYRSLDYNGDGLKDIVVLKSDSYLELYENLGDFEFLNKGNLLYIPEVGSNGSIESGDFTGDSFDDIFFVSGGKPYLYNNIHKDFTKIDLSDQFNLSGSIVETSVFDMDNDSKLDIVTMDSKGEINIFYGSGVNSEPSFTKVRVGTGYTISLNKDKKDGNGAISYFGMKAPKENNLDRESTEEGGLNTNLLDSIIYEYLPVESENKNKNLFTKNQYNGNFGGSYKNAKKSADSLGKYTNTGLLGGINNVENRAFVKNTYSKSHGFKIEKSYKDINTGSLEPLDMMDIEVKIKNISGGTKNDIYYAEDVEDYFNFSNKNEDIELSKDAKIKHNVGNYEFLVGGFSLSSGEEMTIKYKAKLLPLSYGKIETGYFEGGEAGDDEYGDIMIKVDQNVCSTNPDIYRSIGVRSYKKGKKELKCKDSNLKLPEMMEKNSIDENGNGMPDYLDELLEGEPDPEKTEKYGEEFSGKINKDSDGDGMPSTEDETPSYSNNDKDAKEFLSDINDKVDKVSKGIDEISQGLCNGFGGGACITTPFNWAPMVPGNDPVFLGYPIGDGLNIAEGYPIFSVPTGPCGPRTIWPICPKSAGGWNDSNKKGDGKSLFRFYLTPTITGAIGMAICFYPNNMSEEAWPKGIHPFFNAEGGNCIIAAFPFAGCDGDGGDGDVKEKNYPVNVSSPGNKESLGTSGNGKNTGKTNSFGVLNGSCIDSKKQSQSNDFKFDDNFVSNYMDYKATHSESSLGKLQETLSEMGSADYDVKSSSSIIKMGANEDDKTFGPNKSLIQIGGENTSGVDMFINIEVNTSGLKDGQFKDVIKVKNKLIKSFNSYVMDWVDRQLQEVITKLTSLLTIVVILPDFDQLNDINWGQGIDWSSYMSKFESIHQSKQEEWKEYDKNKATELDNYNSQKKEACKNKNSVECVYLTAQSFRAVLEKDYNPNQHLSSIRSLYDFLGTLPLVNIKSEIVNINLPWITRASLLKAKITYDLTKKQYWEEIKRAEKEWSKLGDYEKLVGDKIVLDAKNLINSIDKNIEVLESYKSYPEKLINLLNKKEVRLKQIFCNLNTVYELVGGRLERNGKLFKAWAELYVLIMAIFKSWEIIPKIFDDYSSSCKECKNERYDLRTFVWSIISFIIPKIPVIQFPKWPDIILDLHDINLGFSVVIPEFDFNPRPIVIPELPKLKLPDIPSINIKIPSLPILPNIEIPTLPDIPSLPSVELPNLPPPPTIPKLLAGIEVVLKIIKLILKVQCMLQKSPFATEWTVGVKIAYLTDRQGFSPLDFIHIKYPQYSYSFVDAIKVSTSVNFELTTDFLVEFARQGLKPLNNFTNDVVNFFNYRLPDLDFSSLGGQKVNVDLENQNINIENNNLDNAKDLINNLPELIVYGVYSIYNYIDENKNDMITTKEFVKEVNKGLSSKSIVLDENTKRLRDLWKDVSNLKYSKEDKHIKDLKKKNKDKFDILKDIINKEIELNNKEKKKIDEIYDIKNIKFISQKDDSKFSVYNDMIRTHNLETVNNAKKLFQKDEKMEELKKEGNKLLANVNNALSNISGKLDANINGTGSGSSFNTRFSSGGSCGSYHTKGPNNYKYDYKGIYIVEHDKNYRLFDYIQELGGKEEITYTDLDNDGDQDILYMVKNEIYIKENLQVQKDKNYEINNPITVKKDENKFYNGDIFYESLNNTNESSSSNSFISTTFDDTKRDDIHNFALEYYTTVDKFLNEDYSLYNPKDLKKSIIDNFEDIDNNTVIEEKTKTGYIIRKNLAYVSSLGNNVDDNIVFNTRELVNIKDNISNDKVVSLSSNTKLYAGKNSFIIFYYIDDKEDKKMLKVDGYENVLFDEGVKIYSLKGDAYVKAKTDILLKGQEIRKYSGLPLFNLSEIKIFDEKKENNYNESSNMTVMYYDGTERNLDFRDIRSFKINDLGVEVDNYIIFSPEENDNYYGKLSSFKNNIFSTKSKQILLASQVASDDEKPEINLDKDIRIPVFRKYRYNFTQYLFDNSGYKDFYIDYDLEIDSDKDGDFMNDRNSDKKDTILAKTFVAHNFGPFDRVEKRKIGLNLIDLAGNRTVKEVTLDIYTPEPNITNQSGGLVKGRLEEEIRDFGVNLYKYRFGLLDKLKTKDGKNKILSEQDGGFEFDIGNKHEKGLKITNNGFKIATVNEETGKINLESSLAGSIKILPSNDKNNDKKFVKILLEKEGEELYYEYLDFSNTEKLSYANNFAKIKDEGIYLKLDDLSNYSYYKIPETASHTPGVIMIYNLENKNKPIFSIFPNGEIYSSFGYRYKLKYSTFGENVVFSLYDSLNKKYIGKILMKIDNGNYIIK